MKALVLKGRHELALEEREQPVPGPGEALIRTLTVGICATDLEMIEGNPRVTPPAILGHEWCGVVEAVGEGADKGLIGRKVVGENLMACGRCKGCLEKGECVKPDEIGFERPGAYGAYLTNLCSNLHVLPDDFPPGIAALVEPLAVCLKGTMKISAGKGSEGVVFGDGTIGLMCTLLLSKRGIGVTVVGKSPDRFPIAEKMGAKRVLHYDDDLAHVYSLERSFDFAVEASGSRDGFRSAYEAVKLRGELLALGDYKKAQADFELLDLLHRELTLTASNGTSGAFGNAVDLLPKIKDDLAPLVTHTFSIDEHEKAMTLAREGGAAVKVIMRFE